MLWRRTLQRIQTRIAVTKAFNHAGFQTKLRRRRASILCDLANFQDGALDASDAQVSISVDRWHRAFTYVCVQMRAIRTWKITLKEHSGRGYSRRNSLSIEDRRSVVLTAPATLTVDDR